MEARMQLAEEETAIVKREEVSTAVTLLSGYVLAIMKAETEQLCNAAQGFEITNDSQDAASVELLAEIKRRQKSAKKDFDEYDIPLKKLREKLKKDFAPIIDPLVEAEDNLKERRGDYYMAKERERRRLQAIEDEKNRKKLEKYEEKVAKAEEKGITPPAPPPVTVVQAPEKTVKVESGASANVQMEWKAEIVSEADVPREFCIPSMPKINAAIKLGARNIPGVRIFEQPKISVRTN